jgi:hypothetical protein
VRFAETPTISVQLTSTGQRGRLEERLEQLLPVCERLGAQLVVVRAHTDEELLEMRARFPGVQFTAAPAGTPIPELRALGMTATEGDVVVFGDDADLTAEDLLDRFSKSRSTDND